MISKILYFSKKLIFLPIVVLSANVHGNLDFLQDLYYDSNKAYSSGDSVVLASDPTEIYTAIDFVPAGNPPPNSLYWSDSGGYTNDLTENNSGDLGTVPSSDFNQETPGSPPDSDPSFPAGNVSTDFDENSVDDVYIASASFTDTYTLSSEKDGALFDLNETTGVLSFKVSPNYEDPQDEDTNNTYEVVILAASNTSSNTDSLSLSVNVTNVPETPVFSDGTSASVDFMSGTSGTVYTATATDGPIYSISGSAADDDLFTINSATGIVSFINTPDISNPSDSNQDGVYSVEITASNGPELTSTLSLSIALIPNPSEDTPSGRTDASNEAFVKQQYFDFLGRVADAGGLAYWVGEIDAGRKVRGNLSMDFVYSSEYQNNVAPVVRLYFAYFNRLPDTGGLSYWISEYTSGNRTLGGISDEFASSGEFSATYGSLSNGDFVDLIYNNLFSRTPDSGGKDYWTSELDSGSQSRGTAMVGFSESDEYKNLLNNKVSIVSYYYGMLRRSPDQGGFDYWVGRLDSGDSALDLINGFLFSDEYQGRDFTTTHL